MVVNKCVHCGQDILRLGLEVGRRKVKVGRNYIELKYTVRDGKNDYKGLTMVHFDCVEVFHKESLK